MKQKILLMLVVITLIIINSCAESITGPEPQPGRRDYVWTRDTLRADEFGFQFLSGIWGSAPNDIWVIGDAATYVNKVWHFDGMSWRNYLLDQFAAPIRIHGISSSEIYMVTTISDIWKYNGTRWFKDTTIIPDGYQRILFEDIYGYKNDLYAVGIAEKGDGDYTAIVVYYDGRKWRILNTPLLKEYFLRVIFLEKSNEILISGQNYLEPNEPCRLYRLKDDNISLIGREKSSYNLSIVNNKIYVNTNKRIFEYKDGALLETLDLSSTDYAGRLFGRTIKDFFTANEGWNIGHYNGNDLVNIYYAEGNIIDAQIFEKEALMICYTLDNTNYILHGKLK
ncbi:MAG: hypothetical protein AB1521_16605 [Bacteroidota bacterium]